MSWLGYGGLVPFAALTVAIGADPVHAVRYSQALAGYGAVILSFVGALHWGVAMSTTPLEPTRRRRAFVWSVVPALIAWLALLLPDPARSLVLAVGFVLHLVQDLRFAGPAQLPPWYLPLRTRLTAVATLCLLVNAWFAGRGA